MGNKYQKVISQIKAEHEIKLLILIFRAMSSHQKWIICVPAAFLFLFFVLVQWVHGPSVSGDISIILHIIPPAGLHVRPKPSRDFRTLHFTNISVTLEEMKKGSLNKTFTAKIEPEISWKLERNLHFIWVGRPIPQKYIDTINYWFSRNKNLQVKPENK